MSSIDCAEPWQACTAWRDLADSKAFHNGTAEAKGGDEVVSGYAVMDAGAQLRDAFTFLFASGRRVQLVGETADQAIQTMRAQGIPAEQ